MRITMVVGTGGCWRAAGWRLVLAWMSLAAPCGAGEPLQVTQVPEALRREWKLDPFYAKCVPQAAIPVVASGEVSDFALLEAAWLVDRMLAGRQDVARAMRESRTRLAVMAHDEFTLDVPEHSDLTPAGYWNKRARGLGATRHRPAVSCGEENLLEYPGDPYAGENILIHEFAHAIHEMGLSAIDATFDQRLGEAYEEAIAAGLWKDTYAATNKNEYWAEGVQSWFECNRANTPDHNEVDTRMELAAYDAPLARLMVEVFGDDAWVYEPPSRRQDRGHLVGYKPGDAPRFSWPAEIVEAYQRFEAKRDTR